MTWPNSLAEVTSKGTLKWNIIVYEKLENQ